MEEKKIEIDLLNRLIISEDDFWQAKRFIRYVLEKNLHENEEDDENKLILKACNTATIVSYCRPFTRNWKHENYPATESLPEDYINLLTDDEKRLHKRVAAIRDKEQAHSDPESHSVGLYNNNQIAIKRDATIPLTQEEFSLLEKMIDKFLIKIGSDKNSYNQ